jgi:hypothetical protein
MGLLGNLEPHWSDMKRKEASSAILTEAEVGIRNLPGPSEIRKSVVVHGSG